MSDSRAITRARQIIENPEIRDALDRLEDNTLKQLRKVNLATQTGKDEALELVRYYQMQSRFELGFTQALAQETIVAANFKRRRKEPTDG